MIGLVVHVCTIGKESATLVSRSFSARISQSRICAATVCVFQQIRYSFLLDCRVLVIGA